MTESLRIALAQVNPVVGDLAGNIRMIRDARTRAAAQAADLVVFGELCVCGYPPEDLVQKGAFLDACEAAVRDLAGETVTGPAILVGSPWREAGQVHNAALLLDGGRIAEIQFKRHLPNYGVFDEARLFVPGPLPRPMDFRGVRLGVLVCEDMWYADVAEALARDGAEILVVPNGSPYEDDKQGRRLEHATARCAATGLPLIYVNQVGGQDELVFDGGSFVVASDGALAASLAPWQVEIALTEWRRESGRWICVGPLAAPVGRLEGIYQAMVVGLRDYVAKNRFPGVVLGLSGGIDSALAAAVAVDALGAERVRCVMMPSPYTSIDSLEDAAEVAALLGTRLDTVDIRPAMEAFSAMLAPLFGDAVPDTTEENVQSRARGLTLMALSNKFGPMVLSTGNKSEMSCGYATLYGDMCGGYAVLKDVYKTTVFALSDWRNRHCPPGVLGPKGAVMPERVLTKPPTAELRPNQTDQDSLPPYEVLDGILECLIEGEMSVAETCAKGYDEETVRRVWRMLDRAEYKRRQAPPGVKITARAFGKERRYPITNAFTPR
ncbi:NAD+ synthase [Magnetospirillum molischianum]|uniref:Glutamine-dependent NAD(+) synthetase n=1 Tax=Magnetospirillum molischianum DSM 120 TaxID=1150626 RepID=H8FQF3_MAGML|nr:NAD+ synthase [Magnetospirillum molischianum]CCG40591.1 Glutamine-dependent NAD(+) synthetase [Magnetospirillum molischianum DSM 120]